MLFCNNLDRTMLLNLNSLYIFSFGIPNFNEILLKTKLSVLNMNLSVLGSQTNGVFILTFPPSLTSTISAICETFLASLPFTLVWTITHTASIVSTNAGDKLIGAVSNLLTIVGTESACIVPMLGCPLAMPWNRK